MCQSAFFSASRMGKSLAGGASLKLRPRTGRDGRTLSFFFFPTQVVRIATSEMAAFLSALQLQLIS